MLNKQEELGLELPLVVPFRALNYALDTEKELGIAFSFVRNPVGIISGQEAVEKIYSLDFKGTSGAHRLVRDNDGSWDTCWETSQRSDLDGRVNWICGEATYEILLNSYRFLTERKYGELIRELQKEQEDELTRFEELLDN